VSKSIRSYPESERQRVIVRRLKGNTGGLGYWAAIDAEVYRLRTGLIGAGIIKQGDKGDDRPE
jgi:hypothetical protein